MNPNCLTLLTLAVVSWWATEPVIAQNAASMPTDDSVNGTTEFDYVRSTTPLGDGRSISRIHYPGRNQPPQTTIVGQPTERLSVDAFASRPAGGFPGLPTQPTPRVAALQVPANTVPSLNAPPNQLVPGQLPQFSSPPGPSNFANNCCNGAVLPGQTYPYPTPANVPPGGNVFASSSGPAGIFPGSGGPRPNVGFQPLIRLRAMPPGAYLGQGVIGQPTAYVPGEPIRNFLRYIAP